MSLYTNNSMPIPISTSAEVVLRSQKQNVVRRSEIGYGLKAKLLKLQ